MTDHVSDLQWDRLLAGELTDEAAGTVRAHAAGCTGCASRLRALTAERDAFELRPAGLSFAPPSPGRAARTHWRWSAALVPVLAAAAMVMVLRARPDDASERAKGSGPLLLLAAGRPGALAPLASGDAIHPGEYLQAGYTATRDGFGAVLSRDGAGAVTAYVPAHGETMVALPAGAERSFPRSTLLDEVLGGERIVLVWCTTAQPLAPLLAELRAGQAIAPRDGCTIRDIALDKRAESP